MTREELKEYYIKSFDKLNSEEGEIRSDYSNYEETERKLRDIYDKKDKIAYSFLADIASGNISREDFALEYDIGETFLYDNIYVVNEKGGRLSTIIPNVIKEMENGSELLHDIISDHIDDMYDGEVEYYDAEEGTNAYRLEECEEFYYFGAFPWNYDLSEINSYGKAHFFENYLSKIYKHFGEVDILNGEDKRIISEKKLELDKIIESHIKEDVEKYGLIDEYDAERLEAVVSSFTDEKEKTIAAFLINTYGNAAPQVLTFMQIARRIGIEKFDINTMSVPSFFVNCSKSVEEELIDIHNSDELERLNTFRSIGTDREYILAQMEEIDEESLSQIIKNGDESDILALCKNEDLIDIDELLNKVNDLPIDKQKIAYKNLLVAQNLDKDELKELYENNEVAKEYILEYGTSLPDDLISAFIEEFNGVDLSQKRHYQYYLLCLLKNNNSISTLLCDKILSCIEDNPEKYGTRLDYSEGLIKNKNVPMDVLKEIATQRGDLYKDYLSTGYIINGEKEYKGLSDEVLEAFADHGWSKEYLISDIKDGKIKASEKLFRKLKLDRLVYPGSKLQEMYPDYEEVLPNVDVSEKDFDIVVLNSTDGFGSDRDYFDIIINHQHVAGFSLYNSRFDEISQIREMIISACNSHKEAIEIILNNHEKFFDDGGYGYLGDFYDRIGALSKKLLERDKINEKTKEHEKIIQDITTQWETEEKLKEQVLEKDNIKESQTIGDAND